MKFFLCLVLVGSQLLADDLLIEARYNPVLDLQQKGGEIGTSNPEALTSIALFAMISNMETPTSKKHGKNVSRMISYLEKASIRLQEEELSIKHLYVLWALSETLTMTGEPTLKEPVESLFKYIVGKCFKDNKPNFGVLISPDCMFMMVRSLRSYIGTQLPLSPTKNMMGSYALHCLSELGYKEDVSLALFFITSLWDIDDIFVFKGIPLPAKKMEELKQGLNSSSSKERKKYFLQCQQLNAGQLKYFVSELEKSDIVEHREVARELSQKGIEESVFRSTISNHTQQNANVLNLYFSYAYSKCRHHMKEFQNEVKKAFSFDEWADFKKLNTDMPKLFETMSDEEHKLSLYCFVLEMTYTHRNIKPENSKKWKKLQLLPSEMKEILEIQDEADPFAGEGGLELIE